MLVAWRSGSVLPVAQMLITTQVVEKAVQIDEWQCAVRLTHIDLASSRDRDWTLQVSKTIATSRTRLHPNYHQSIRTRVVSGSGEG